MKFIYQFICMAALMVGTALSFSSCKDDGATENEWNATYVYIQRNDYLILNNSQFSIKHSPAGIVGDVEITFKMKIQKPATEDITGVLQVTANGDIPASVFTLSSDRPVIKAGSTESEEITFTLTGKEELAQTQEMLSGEFEIRLAEIQTGNFNTVITTNQSLAAIPVSLTKQEFSINNLEVGEPENSKTMDRTSWYVQIEDGVEGTPSNLTDGNLYTDVARDKTGFWITIDFQTAKTITGIRTNHWGGGYCPTQIEMFSSDDGQKWKTMGTLDVSGNVHYIKFITPVTTRHIKYQMLKVPSRVDVTEFNVYEPK